MEGSNWRPAQGQPTSVTDGGSGDWRSQLPPEARQRIVNKIGETLERHLPVSVPEGLNELHNIAIRFEDKIYSTAANQSDYLRQISLKMLSMESKSQHPGGPGQINPSINQNPVDPAQVNNQGQPITTVNPSSTRQQLLPQNIQLNSSIGSQSTSSLPSALSSFAGLSQSTISSVSQSSSFQNMTGMSQNSISNSLGQAAASDIYSTAQRQMQGRQQQQMISQQQHQSQNQFVYQQPQYPHPLLKQKLQQSALSQSHVQQQSLLQQPTQLQSSQQPLLPVASNLQSGQ